MNTNALLAILAPQLAQRIPAHVNSKEAQLLAGPVTAGGIAKLGRRGDDLIGMLSPQEAMLLKILGGVGTENPRTGLPEFNDGGEGDGGEGEGEGGGGSGETGGGGAPGGADDSGGNVGGGNSNSAGVSADAENASNAEAAAEAAAAAAPAADPETDFASALAGMAPLGAVPAAKNDIANSLVDFVQNQTAFGRAFSAAQKGDFSTAAANIGLGLAMGALGPLGLGLQGLAYGTQALGGVPGTTDLSGPMDGTDAAGGTSTLFPTDAIALDQGASTLPTDTSRSNSLITELNRMFPGSARQSTLQQILGG